MNLFCCVFRCRKQNGKELKGKVPLNYEELCRIIKKKLINRGK